jgi:hypothetical protein
MNLSIFPSVRILWNGEGEPWGRDGRRLLSTIYLPIISPDVASTQTHLILDFGHGKGDMYPSLFLQERTSQNYEILQFGGGIWRRNV